MSHIKGLSAFKPLGVIGIDWETWMWRCVYCLMNLVGASTDMSKCAVLVSRPAINVISVVQLVKNVEPIMQQRMSPAGLDDCIVNLVCVSINGRLIGGHSIHSQCIQEANVLSQWTIKLGDLTATLKQLHYK